MRCNLVMVTEGNNNKYYNIELVGDCVHIRRGRIGQKEIIETPLSGGLLSFEKRKNEKIKKGYVDITELKSIAVVKGFDYKGLSNEGKKLYDLLLMKSRHFVAETFISSEFSPCQMDRIEGVLRLLKGKVYNDKGVSDLILSLFRISPRKIKSVPHYIKEVLLDSKSFNEFLVKEDDVLENIKISVSSTIALSGGSSALDFIELESIEILSDKKELIRVYELMDRYEKFSDRIVNVYKVTSRLSEIPYQDHLKKYGNSEKLFFHGSRTENWFSILKTCLTTSPKNVSIAGKMFSEGIYFADKFKKSRGYTSISDSYWSKGTDKTAFMGVYAVNMSKPFIIKKHESWMTTKLNLDFLTKKGYRTVHAKGGYDLMNDEFVIYENNACTIRYLIEFR